MNMTQWQRFCSEYFIGQNTHIEERYHRLSVYKESIEVLHYKALETSFPVLLRLLGRKAFKSLAYEYITHKNWQSHSIDNLGFDFNKFIGDYKPLQSICYLSEVAKIEWLVQSLAEKSTRKTKTAQKLQELLINEQDFYIKFLPNIQFIESSQGGMEVWLAHQQETIIDINLSGIETSYWCIHNRIDSIHIDRVSEEEFSLVRELRSELSIKQVCENNDLDLVVQKLVIYIQQEWIYIN